MATPTLPTYDIWANTTQKSTTKTGKASDITADLPTTGAPTGLAVTRDGAKYTITWKPAPTQGYNGGLQFGYRVKTNGSWGKWTDSNITKTLTEKSHTFSVTDYYPLKTTKLDMVAFRVRGKKKLANKKKYRKVMGTSPNQYVLVVETDECQWSAWSSISVNVAKPAKPTLTVTKDTSVDYKCAFSWSVKNDPKSTAWYRSVEWQTMLVTNCTEKDGSKLNWNSSATDTSTSKEGTITRTESATTASITRWLRIRSRGAQGASDWVYKYMTYATPAEATAKVSTKVTEGNGGVTATVSVSGASTTSQPCDTQEGLSLVCIPQYANGNFSPPSGASGWYTYQSLAYKKNQTFSIQTQRVPGLDECAFNRIDQLYKGKRTQGTPTLLNYPIKLTPPTGLSVTPEPSTYKMTVRATNNCRITGSFLAIVFKHYDKPGVVVDIMTSGEKIVQCPNWSSDSRYSISVYAVVGPTPTYVTKTEGGVTYRIYTINAAAKSTEVTSGGEIPLAPANVTATKSAKDAIEVKWSWSWAGAEAAELSWSDRRDAWESTDEPRTYTVSARYQSRWVIAGVESGKMWYVRVRLFKGETYGPWSEIAAVNLADAPKKPRLALSKGSILGDETFTAFWEFESGDDTGQDYAEIREKTGSTYGTTTLASVTSALHADIKCPSSWAAGSTHLICVRVKSASGLMSAWSDPVAIAVVAPLTATITATSLETITIGSGETEREVTALTEMPLTATVTGSGAGGTTTLIIERAADYQLDRPDGSEYIGFEGETVAIYSQLGASAITIDQSDLVGILDDGASYRLIAIVQDSYGQSDSASIDFEVHWTEQALMPVAEEEWLDNVVKILIGTPQGARQTDRCDIYRLSADPPMLIYKDAEFGHTYVDPYPAMGDFGGHRVVYKTINGDYITEDNHLAWVDIGDLFDADYSIIDFGGVQTILQLNMRLSNSWKKDFIETKYLGGSVQGDWNPAVSRTATLSAVAVIDATEQDIQAMRALAAYPGICHVRTPDGSSFAADIQVSESRTYQDGGKKIEYSLNITRVDPEGLEALPIENWEEEQE